MALLHHLTMADIISRIIAALLFAGAAGGLTALLQSLLGDRSAAYEKRLSFSPFAHVSLSGIFLAIAFRASWFTPLSYDRAKRSFRPLAAVLLAMALMLCLVPLLDLLRSPLHGALSTTIGYSVLFEIETLQRLIVNSVALGLLPLPGLWLGNALPAAFPALQKRYRKMTGIGLSAAAILLVLGWFPEVDVLSKLLRLV